MIERTFQTFVLPACIVASCVFAGCMTQYAFEFKDAKSRESIVNAPVELTSCHRFYSFLDARHYLAADSGKAVTVEGRTDEEGKVTLSLPSDLGIKYVCLDSEWFAREPSSAWQPMLTEQEYEAGIAEADVQMEQDRPLIRGNVGQETCTVTYFGYCKQVTVPSC